MDKQAFHDFLQAQPLAIISTVSPESRPEAAVVGFCCTPELEIIFGTRLTTRKYANLQANPYAAFAIGWDRAETVQYEGAVTFLTGQDVDEARKLYLEKNPYAAKWAYDADFAFLKATPSWARYTDLKQQPWNVQEVTF